LRFGGSDEMTEQELISDAVLNTPDPDRFVDCGESRPLAMFHKATLMQYGERCAEAALEWARTQQEPVGWDVTIEKHLMHTRTKEQAEQFAELGYRIAPLYVAPVAPTVPKGWKLVPVEPTDRMIEAAFETSSSRVDIYQHMLAAAPEHKEGE